MISPKINRHTSPSTLIYLHLFGSTLPCSLLPSSTPTSPFTRQSTSSDSALPSPASYLVLVILVQFGSSTSASSRSLSSSSTPSPASSSTGRGRLILPITSRRTNRIQFFVRSGKAQAWRKTRCILPHFSLMKSPLPPPLPIDPPEEDEDERAEGRGRAGEGRQARKLWLKEEEIS